MPSQCDVLSQYLLGTVLERSLHPYAMICAMDSGLGLDVVASLPRNGSHEEGSDAASVLVDSGDISIVLRDKQISKNSHEGKYRDQDADSP